MTPKQMSRTLRRTFEQRFKGTYHGINVMVAMRKSTAYHVYVRVEMLDKHGQPSLIGWDALPMSVIADPDELGELADVAWESLQTEPERTPDASGQAIIH